MFPGLSVFFEASLFRHSVMYRNAPLCGLLSIVQRFLEDAEMERLTTKEAADVLHCAPAKALALLHAANVPSSRIGPFRGALLWDGARVRELAALCKASERTDTGE